MPNPPSPDPLVRIFPDVLGPVTYQALLLDRVTRRVRGDLTVPADLMTTAELRAAALVPDRCVVGRQAAVWVHTGSHEPLCIEVLVGPRGRRPDPHPGRTTHECELPEADVVLLGSVRVTSVQRTGLDLARWFPAHAALAMLAPLCEHGFDPAAALDALARLGGYAGVRDARATLARLVSRQSTQARITGCSAALPPVSR
jgi:hypothetical protein